MDQQGYGQQPPHGQPPQGWGPPPQQPPKKKARLWLWALIALPVACIGIAVMGAASAGRNAGEARKSALSAPDDLPWFSQVEQNCTAYKQAPNDIKRSAIYREHEALVTQQTIQNARGKLKRLQTNQGGSELTLAVEVGDATFATESVFAAIKQGTTVYNAATELRVGQCVVFSASKLAPSSLVERSKVCDLDYFAEFTSISGC